MYRPKPLSRPSSGIASSLMLIGALLLLCRLDDIYLWQDEAETGLVSLNLLTYGTVLLLFLVVYRQRARSLLSATLVVGITTLLAMELLRGTGRPLRSVALYALVVGLVLGEATWALNYWQISGLTGGLLLLLGFYLLVGLAHQGLLRRLTRRVLLEFGAVAAVSLVLIGLFAP